MSHFELAIDLSACGFHDPIRYTPRGGGTHGKTTTTVVQPKE